MCIRDRFRVDPHRSQFPETGIYVRAKDMADLVWVNADIAHLDRESLRRWLRSHGGDNPLAENTVLILLGWDPYEKNDAQKTASESDVGRESKDEEHPEGRTSPDSD